MTPETDLYQIFTQKLGFKLRLKQFAKERGIELTIAIVGLFIGIATVLVSNKIGVHQEILQASRMTDSYFNGVAELFARGMDENQRINLIIIARTEAIIEDLNQIKKPDKLASIITFVSHLKPKLFYREDDGESKRDKYIFLSDINLEGAYLRNINLEKSRLANSNLRKADLGGTNLKDTNAKRVNFEKANLDRVNFTNADLHGANFYKASIKEAIFTNANLEGAIWVNGKRCEPGSIGECHFK
ncbi:pentapeptide repeat-containing protein [Candidatus Berkiella aquae]|uniref:Pentapeptide repeat-containing protein n=1 Tax=Candidatus Berkiella aquae TaxID=295108 RepID=A0A0Q9YRT2_9GAMM|nr:pentapeptide repeat-containing protein [Candidatus Berkiella aquae]MCS5711710.1 pentapeptide repeat-containing protein [Candidatus Berkiella aquae]